MAYYQGKYKVKHPSRYKGDNKEVIYRSGWEKSCFQWLDGHPDVIEWSSEEVVIPYLYEVDKRYHRYFMDLYVKFKDRTVLIEIKPKKETTPPAKQGKAQRTYVSEAMTYVKNQNKWNAAKEYAADRGWHFEVWTEVELKAMGILKTVGKKPLKKMKKMQPYRKKKSKK